MGIGYASGDGRSLTAARNAISSPMLEASIEGARGVILNVSGGSDLGLLEVNEAAEVIHGVCHPDANIIFGAVIDDDLGDEVRVTVIAAGFDRWDDRDPRPGTADAAAAPGSTSSRVLDEVDVFSSSSSSKPSSNDLGLDNDDEFDVPSFLK